MTNKYRDDPNLDLLQFANNELLSGLVDILIKDDDGKLRRTETLTDNPHFKQAQEKGDYYSVWKLIAAELQHYGGDTIVNHFRKTGVLYEEIVKDVCDVLKIDSKEKLVVELENEIIQSLFKKSWEKFSDEEKDKILENSNLDKELRNIAISKLIPAIGMAHITPLVVNLVSVAMGRTVIMRAGMNFFVGRIGTVWAGPLGAIVGILSAIPSITGTAYRVTIPAVVFIAAMRQEMNNEGEF